MTGKVNLSARMKAVADLVTVGSSACDVGCDHGYVSIYLVQERKAPKVLAMDVNKGPLERAAINVRQAGLSEYITLRLSDGLSKYQIGEAESLVIAGMGGRLMKRILERETEKTRSFRELILQPQSELAVFREFLRNMGYSIADEDMILEEDKFYPIIKAVAGTYQGGNPQLEDRFGPVLLKKKHPVLTLFLQKEWESSLKIRTELLKAGDSPKVAERLQELSVEMDYLYQAARVCGCEKALTDLK
ncbi:MAG: SAM-dependent methyltransferase [Lachnospiraceae bacterium]|nr:SAM-dependent methyltransferase [Lachnospiraceae bacterium]